MSARTVSFRPRTARAVAGRSKSLGDFGNNLRDWLHELRRVTTREGLRQACWHRPPRLAGAVAGGEIADAFLEKFGGDSIAEIRRNYEGYLGQIKRF